MPLCLDWFAVWGGIKAPGRSGVRQQPTSQMIKAFEVLQAADFADTSRPWHKAVYACGQAVHFLVASLVMHGMMQRHTWSEGAVTALGLVLSYAAYVYLNPSDATGLHAC